MAARATPPTEVQPTKTADSASAPIPITADKFVRAETVRGNDGIYIE